jgi:uncharacterized protein DUF4390
MPALKKNNTMFNSYKILKIVCVIFTLICIHNLSYANTINIKSTHAYTEDETYYLDVLFDFALTEEAYKALRHGIPLEIHTHFQLRLKREWLWDKTINEIILIYKLEHKPLTEHYLTVDLKTGLRRSYENIDIALKHISSISKMELFNQDLLNKDEKYIARIRTFLDIESLPPPMRPQAYFSPSWDISSEWYEWEVIQ